MSRQNHHTKRSLLSVVSLLAATFILAGGISYAALVSQPAVVKGNTIETGFANLLVSADGITFGNSLTGYYFGGLIPGGSPMPAGGDPVYLRNAGNSPLAVNLRVPAGFTNPNNLDLSKVHLILSPIGGGAAQNYTLQALVDGVNGSGVALTGSASRMIVNQTVSYNMQIMLEADAVNGPTALLGNLEFDFGATAVN